MKQKLSLLTLLLILTACFGASAALKEPVKWSTEITMTSSTEGYVTVAADVEPGWHLYGTDLPEDGPRSTAITFDKVTGAELKGALTPSVKPVKGVDEIFNLTLSWWNTPVTFRQNFVLTGNQKGCEFSGTISFQACNNNACVSPTKIPFDLKWGDTPAVVADSQAAATVTTDSTKTTDVQKETTPELSVNEWWKPADFSSFTGTLANEISKSPWWYIFIWGFLGGLVALLTPCVWPLIPMTVSFFLKKGGNRRKAVKDALLYGFAIIVIYLVLGLAITLIFGAGKLNELSTSALFNLAFFLLLVVFAISFFGAFEIRLPEKWGRATDGRAENTSGIISIFFMAFTLALVSFSCTGPIIGTLLVEAASNGSITGPAIGMGAFALALAIPFALFALFPTWLKEMPRSGGWLNSVKVVLGFLELALSLKFLSVADLAYGWGLLDREIFICLWIVIFVLLGMYLLGKISFSHDSPLQHVSLPRFFMALASWSFAIYLLPGLWGAPLKGVSAFVPPLFTQDFNLYEGGKFKEFDDYDEGMRFAAEQKKPVLIDFSGYGCVNCRKMEGAVFDTPEVSALVKNDFVLIKLMVDDKQKLPEALDVEENGRTIRLETVGDKWSYLQRIKFKANIQPYYVVLDNEGQPMNAPYSYDENIVKFMDWLTSGLNSYNANR